MRAITLFLTRLALLWERGAPLVWPTLAALALFAILALGGVWEWLGDPARTLAVLALLGLAIWQTAGALPDFYWPSEEDAARRAEEDSGIPARPHEALIDQPADADPLSQRLWLEHRSRMARQLRDARAHRPRAAWAIMDPHAIRGGIAVVFVTMWLLAGPDARSRLNEAFSPQPIASGGATITVDTWIDPPAYTGRAPVFLDAETRDVSAPQGSVFVARIAGAERTPSLTGRTLTDRNSANIQRIGDGVWEARLDLAENQMLRLIAGRTRASWEIEIERDAAPDIRMLAVPEATAAGELDIAFEASDDYGITAYAIEFRPENDSEAEWESLEITPAGVSALSDGDGQRAIIETARHALAGQRVDLRLAAEDAAGNIGRSAPLGVTLPERVFLDGLARAVAEQRRDVMTARADYAALNEPDAILAGDVLPGDAYLAEDPARRIERAPEGIQRSVIALDAISDAPAYFFDDPIVYLGLREIVHRVRRARSDAGLGTIVEDLWLIALRAELGSLADAEAALRAAERALAEALARGADETELAALFDAFQDAMDNYMAALAREAAEEGNFAEGEQGGSGGLNQDGLQALLDALREAAELGDTAEARQALAALSELLRNMEMQLGQGSGDGDTPDPVAEAIQRALEELGDVIGEQRDLQDQTFGLSQEQGSQGQPQSGGSGQQQPGGDMPGSMSESQSGAGSAQELAQMQADLAGQLQQSLQALPEGSEPGLNQAGDAMDDAAEALRNGDPDGALEAQEQALADLRAGAEELARDLLERMQDGQANNGEGQENRDPLGRPADGAFADGSGVELPDELSRARAREILQQLRDRAAEAGRPQDELDYIERLLDRF